MPHRAFLRYAIPVGAFFGALGWWLPWVLAESGAAALVLLGLDLGDFWKFTAEWRAGLFQLERHLFFLPPALAAMILSLWLAGQRGWGRWLLLPLLLFLAVVILPALDILLPNMAWLPPRILHDNLAREFSFQLYLSLATLATVLLIPLWRHVGKLIRVTLITFLALAGAILPAWALWRTWLILDSFYGGTALVGPGVTTSCAGFGLAAVAAIASPLLNRRV